MSSRQACFLPEAADFIAKTTEECRALSFPLSRHGYALGLQELAKELGVVISAGIHDVPEEGEDDEADSLRVFNTHILIDKDGSIKARYSKVSYHIVCQLTAAAPLRRRTEPAAKGGRLRPST